MIDLLHEPHFGVQISGRSESVSLAGLMAVLSSGRHDDAVLTEVRTHQAPAVEVFLAMLAAHALEVAGKPLGPYDEGQWARMLGALTGGEDDSFWQLVHADATDAAFMQPALAKVPAWAAAQVAATPGEADTLLASGRCHDVKPATMVKAAPAHWAYTLITLQTTSGFAGNGLYGVARMNRGTGTRVFAAAYRAIEPAARFREDVERLLAHWKTLAWGTHEVRIAALEPWDSETGLTRARLHPGVIEVCRRVRLAGHSGQMHLLTAGSAARRLADSVDVAGVCDDPYSPLLDDGAQGVKAMSSTPGGLGLADALRVLFEMRGARRPPFAQAGLADARWFSMRALSRKQGGTEGWCEQWIELSPALAAALASGRASTLAEAAREMTERYAAATGARVAARSGAKIVQAAGDAARLAVRAALAEQLVPWIEGALAAGADDTAAMAGWQGRMQAASAAALRDSLYPVGIMADG